MLHLCEVSLFRAQYNEALGGLNFASAPYLPPKGSVELYNDNLKFKVPLTQKKIVLALTVPRVKIGSLVILSLAKINATTEGIIWHSRDMTAIIKT